MKKILFAILISFCAMVLHAQDKAVLDALVAKGVLSADEAMDISKNMGGVVVSTKTTEAEILRFGGLMQLQYEWIDTRMLSGNGAPLSAPHVNSFIARRIEITAEATLGAGWLAHLTTEFANNMTTATPILDAFVKKTVDYDYLKGNLELGFRKIYFGYETWSSSKTLLTVDRSIVSNYWGDGNNGRRLGFGGRYTGAYWQGQCNFIEGLTYGVSVTNSYNNNPIGQYRSSYEGSSSTPNIWTNVKYAKKFEGGSFEFGMGFGYGDGANNVETGRYNGSMYGFSPYLLFSYENFSMWTDFYLSGVEYGAKYAADDYRYAKPMGANFCAQYLFDLESWGKLGVVFRYAWLDTDNRGLTASDSQRHSKNVSGDSLYNAAQTVYIGLNWLVINHSLKFQLGYEWSQLNGSPFSGNAHLLEGNCVRAQVQVLF